MITKGMERIDWKTFTWFHFFRSFPPAYEQVSGARMGTATPGRMEENER